jgi:hypothetical protein
MVVLVGLQHEAVVLHPLDELVGPGAHGLDGEAGVADLGHVLRRNDADGAAVPRAHPHRQQRERVLGDDVDRQRIDHLDVVDRGDARPAGCGLLGIEHPLDAELDGGRVEGLAVVELHVPAELELPGRVVEELPRLREVPLELQGLEVPPEERVEDLAVRLVRVLVAVHVPIERRGLARLHDDDGLLLGGRVVRRQPEDRGEGQGPDVSRGPTSFGGLRSSHRKPPLCESTGGPRSFGCGASGGTDPGRRAARRPGG